MTRTRQVEALKGTYGSKFSEIVVLTDVGSGLSTNRRSLTIVTSFAGKLYGYRSHKVKKLKEEVKEALERLDTDDERKAAE